nr:PD-(D/E)XK nuclease family protein [Pirellula staleyi]
MHWRPHWSYSAISQYLTCPLRYYFQRILCLPQPSISASLIFGSTVHEVLADYHRSIVKTETNSVEFYRDRFRKAWIRRENESEVTYKAGENTSDLMDQGIALVELYLQEKPPEGIVAIEEEILCPVHNSKGEYLEKPLLAVADLITRKQDELTIQEFKTSGRAY